MKYRLGVRAALILLVMILVGPVLALVVYTSISEQESALEKARTRVRVQAQLRAASQEQLFEGVRHLLMVVSHAQPIRDAIPERCSPYLRDQVVALIITISVKGRLCGATSPAGTWFPQGWVNVGRCRRSRIAPKTP